MKTRWQKELNGWDWTELFEYWGLKYHPNPYTAIQDAENRETLEAYILKKRKWVKDKFVYDSQTEWEARYFLRRVIRYNRKLRMPYYNTVFQAILKLDSYGFWGFFIQNIHFMWT